MALLLAPAAAQASIPAEPVPAGTPASATIDIRIEGLRSTKGMVRACLTKVPALFLKCDQDPASLRASMPAANGAQLHFAGVAPGDYALVVLHDENENRKVDTILGIPKEGVGFSRNPVLIIGPPSFAAVRFTVADGYVAQLVKLRYFL